MNEKTCIIGMCNNRVSGSQMVCDECTARKKEEFRKEKKLQRMEDPLDPYPYVDAPIPEAVQEENIRRLQNDDFVPSFY